MRRWLLAGTLLAVGLGATPGWRGDLARAEGRLESGRWRLAEQDFRALMRVRPNHRVRIGLARALAGGGDCEEALALLDGLVGVRGWTVDASMAQGRCSARRGQLWDSVEIYGLATERAPEELGPWAALASSLDALGEVDARDGAIDRLVLLPGGVELWVVLSADFVARAGEPDRDAALFEARRVVGDAAGLAVLEGRHWLELGHPAAAERVLLSALRRSPGHGQLALWRVEALRRMGDADAAWEALESPGIAGTRNDALARVIEARVRVDRGDQDGAEARLDGIPDEFGAELVASRWYLERARGQPVQTPALATLWRACEPNPGLRLSVMIPWETE